MSDHEYEPGNHENILNSSDNQIENTKEQPKDDPLIISTFIYYIQLFIIMLSKLIVNTNEGKTHDSKHFGHQKNSICPNDRIYLSTCPECSEFCIIKSKTILCKVWRVSWHIKCRIPKITNYYQNNKTNWACSGRKQSKPKSTQVIQNTQEPLKTTTITVNSDDTTSKKSTLSSSSITITR